MQLTKRTLLIPAASLLLLSACVQPSAYKDPISDFQKASTIVIKGARSEYKAVNKRERDSFIDRRIADKKEINISTINNTVFLTKEDFAARFAALHALERHGELLFKLASSATPEEAKIAVNALDDSLLKLKTSLKQEISSDFKTKAGSFATIAGEVTKLVLNAKIEEALKEAIMLSEKDVSALITLFENEMVAFHARQESTLSQARVLATDEYNQELKKTLPDPDKLKIAGARIKQAEDAWEEFPSELGFSEMNDAHQELVNYAKKKSKSSKDLAELVAAMEVFAEQAKTIADAMKTFQQ